MNIFIKSFFLKYSPLKPKTILKIVLNWVLTSLMKPAKSLNPQKASMFSNERKFRFLDLSNPKPNLNEKSLKTPSFYTKIHHLSNVPKNFNFLLTLLYRLDAQ